MTQIFALIGGAVAIGIALLVVLYGAAICRYCSACGKPVKLVKWVDKDEVGDG